MAFRHVYRVNNIVNNLRYLENVNYFFNFLQPFTVFADFDWWFVILHF